MGVKLSPSDLLYNWFSCNKVQMTLHSMRLHTYKLVTAFNSNGMQWLFGLCHKKKRKSVLSYFFSPPNKEKVSRGKRDHKTAKFCFTLVAKVFQLHHYWGQNLPKSKINKWINKKMINLSLNVGKIIFKINVAINKLIKWDTHYFFLFGEINKGWNAKGKLCINK